MVEFENISEEKLYDMYINQEMTIAQIAHLTHHDCNTISKRLDFYKIPKRKQINWDITNQKFTKLTAMFPLDDNYNADTLWHCQCDCGKTKDVSARNLRYKQTRSCGCIKSEATIKFNKETKTKYNQYDLSGEYGIGWTSNTNEIFLFDKEDFDKIKDYCWSKSSEGYLVARDKGAGKSVRFHQIVMGDKHIDHIKHDKLDNRKSELRKSCDLLNARNRVRPQNNKSGFKGVCWDNTKELWRAYISINKQHIDLGFFDDINDAIQVRKEAEEKYFRDWSYKNSMEMDTGS